MKICFSKLPLWKIPVWRNIKIPTSAKHTIDIVTSAVKILLISNISADLKSATKLSNH